MILKDGSLANLKLVALFCITSLLSSSCATLFGNTSQLIEIESEPSGASVYINGDLVGKTPLKHTIKRETFKSFSMILKMQGYETEEVLMSKTIQSTTLFNFGFISTTMGGPSFLTDALSGALVEFSPNKYFIELSRRSASVSAQNKSLTFLVIHRQSLVTEAYQQDAQGIFTNAVRDLFSPDSGHKDSGDLTHAQALNIQSEILELEQKFPSPEESLTWARHLSGFMQKPDNKNPKQIKL